MKVLNIMWKYTTGGIGKCFLTYARIGDVDEDIQVVNYCIDPQNFDYDRKPLQTINAKFVEVKKRTDFSWINKIYDVIKEEKPDVIFTHGQYGPIIIQIVRMFHKDVRHIPMVGSYHGLYNPPTKIKTIIATPLNRLQCWLYKHYVQKVVIVAEYSGLYLLEHGVQKNKLAVAYNGLPKDEPEIEAVDLPKQVVKMGLAARIDAIKGIEYLLEALAGLKKRVNKKIHLYIIGDGPLFGQMQELTKQLGVEDVISFEGYQSNVPCWLKAWDIFVLPSLQENHSIALLEAMRAGKGIVCTNVGGNPETVTDGKEALVVPSKDSKALENALYELIENEDKRKELGENAKDRFCTTFTETNTLESLAQVMREVTR